MRSQSSPAPSTSGLLAAGPRRINWQIENLASSDGHALTARFAATAALATSAADVAMIRETFAVEPAALSIEAVRDHFRGAIEHELANTLSRQTAEVFDAAGEVDRVSESLAKVLRAAGFAAGIRIVEPFALTIESPSRQRLLLEQAARTRTSEALAHAASTMQQFQKLRETHPELSTEQVLAQVGSAGEKLLPTLLHEWAKNRAASSIVVTSGEKVFEFTATGELWNPKLLELGGTVGALRCVLPLSVRGERVGERALAQRASLDASRFLREKPSPPPSPRVQGEGGSAHDIDNGAKIIQSPRSALAVGGQSGVLLMGDATTVYLLPANRISPLGVNAIAIGESHLFATHSEFGLLVWPIDQPDQLLVYALPGAKLARLIDGDRCLLAAGEEVYVADASGVRKIAKPIAAAVVAIVTLGSSGCVIFADGTVARFDRDRSQLVVENRLAQPIAHATTIDWLGEPRLLVGNDRGEIEVIGENSRQRFSAGHTGWRKIVAAADVVAALSLDRTRLILWRPWEPRQPIAEIHVASITQHRVSDVALISPEG